MKEIHQLIITTVSEIQRCFLGRVFIIALSGENSCAPDRSRDENRLKERVRYVHASLNVGHAPLIHAGYLGLSGSLLVHG